MIDADLLVHTATIERYEGEGAYGERYAAAVEVPCFYDGVRRLVRDSAGSEGVSEGTLYANLSDLPEGSRVTVEGRVTYAMSVTRRDDRGITGLAHVEAALA